MEDTATGRLVARETDGAVATLTLQRPEVLNALSVALLDELVQRCEELHRADEVRVVVLRGAGRAFSAGADLSTVELLMRDGPEARAAADAGDRAARALEELEQVTVAAIHGRCVGGGVVLTAACDLRVAADDTVFSIPEVDLGIPLAWGGIPRLVRELPPAVVRDLVLTCREFGAEEAARHGFLTRTVAADHLDAEVATLTTALASKPRLPVRATLDGVAAELGSGVPRGWSDADTLLTAIRDPESRAAGQAYLARVLGEAADPSPSGSSPPSPAP